MTFALRCFVSNPQAVPCDLDWSADPVAVVAASFAVAVLGLGFLALIYLLAKRGSR